MSVQARKLSILSGKPTRAKAQLMGDGTTKDEGEAAYADMGVTMEDIQRIVNLITRASETDNVKLIYRALRFTTPVRKRISPDLLCLAIKKFVKDQNPLKYDVTLSLFRTLGLDGTGSMSSEAVEMDDLATGANEVPEVDVFLFTLALTTLLAMKKYEEAFQYGKALIDRVRQFNRRIMDPLAAKSVFYYSQSARLSGHFSEIRPDLLAMHRTACLRHDNIGQATILNLLLYNYLSVNLVDMAYKLATKTNFPESVSNNQFCRFLYYMGRIHAIQLDYTDAYNKLTQSMRKAPQNTALGFRKQVQKWAIVVQLLMGEIPERSIFNQIDMRIALHPYFQMTRAVRLGNIREFDRVMNDYGGQFRADGLCTLVQRLSHNVIKTGLRKINLSYSKIHIKDIKTKLQLDSDPSSMEYVVSKAIRDGVIDATIDHKGGYIQSHDILDVYTTNEPQQAFHKRISFCLDVHNEAVRAMRYPPDAYKELRKPDGHEKSIEELAKEIEDEIEDDVL